MAGRVAPGSRLGRAIANLTAETLAKYHDATRKKHLQVTSQAVRDHMEGWEDQLAPWVKKVYASFAEDESIPPEIRELITALGDPPHDAFAILQWVSLIPSIMAITGAAAAGFVQTIQQRSLAATPSTDLSPPDLAQLFVRSPFAELSDVAARALKAGVNEGTFTDFVALAGEPPGPEQLVELYRRHLIDDATLELGIRQSRIYNQWIPQIKLLQYQPPSPSDALHAAIRNRLSIDVAKNYAAEGGLDPANFDWVLDSIGNPIAPGEAFQLYHRGVITLEQVEQTFREGNLMNKYVGILAQLQTPIPSLFEIRNLVSTGAVTDEIATEWVLHLGYSAEIAAAIVHAAHATKSGKAKELAESIVLKLYEERAIPRDEAEQLLSDLGYSTGEVALLLELADHQAEYKAQGQLITRTHSRYVGWHISLAQASGDLDVANVAPAQRDELLHLWTVERQSNMRTLTEAQTIKALNNGLITEPDALARLTNMGYSDVDARLLIGGA